MAKEPKIGEFLSELEDPAKLKAFHDDREKAMKDFGLTDTQRETLRSNDLERIRKALAEEHGKTDVRMFVWVIGAANV